MPQLLTTNVGFSFLVTRNQTFKKFIKLILTGIKASFSHFQNIRRNSLLIQNNFNILVGTTFFEIEEINITLSINAKQLNREAAH